MISCYLMCESLKRSTGMMEVQLLALHGTTPRITSCAWEHCPNISWTPLGLVLWPLPWGTFSSAQTLSMKRLFLISKLHLPDTTSCHFLGCSHWSWEKKHYLPSAFPCEGGEECNEVFLQRGGVLYLIIVQCKMWSSRAVAGITWAYTIHLVVSELYEPTTTENWRGKANSTPSFLNFLVRHVGSYIHVDVQLVMCIKYFLPNSLLPIFGCNYFK